MRVLSKVSAGRYEVSCEGAEGLEARLSSRRQSEGIDLVDISVRWPGSARPEPFRLVWHHPLVNTHCKWFPGCGADRMIMPEWRGRRVCRSRNTCDAPVYALFSSDGRNALTFAFSDALNAVSLSAGVTEETASVRCEVELFSEPAAPVTEYAATLRLDVRPVEYHEALHAVSDWWASMPEAVPARVPEHARMPMYSSWYAFHQRLEATALEKQCRIAKTLGMESVIVDDGWQTDDTGRGYAYCGDWEVTPRKFPDFAGHVARVHDMGMKYLLWFSVPFVGVHSKAYDRFRDKVLDPGAKGWHVLDPRFAQVRDYLVSLYESFVDRYDIDGFKLDFVDTFGPSGETGGGRDFDSVPEAVDRLLTDVLSRLRARKEDVLVEFRQSYIGPLMRKYGNMFRAGDVPGDYHGNRLSTLDIRLLSGNTPAHSDMVMWHPEEPAAGAAMQLAHTLFSVPQVSVLLDRIPPEHVRVIRRYLSLWREHRDVLLDGRLAPCEPGLLYPAVVARTEEKLIAACYGDALVRIEAPLPGKILVVNGTFAGRVLLDVHAKHSERRVTITSCTGEQLSETRTDLRAGVMELRVPPAGAALMEGNPAR